MEKKYIKLGKNIRCLRTSYGETLEELAFAVGLSGSSAIENYENGSRTPIRDVLVKIAGHYKITVDELINGNFAVIDYSSIPLDDDKALINITKKILPIISTETSMNDSNFKLGYELHTKIYNELEKGISWNDCELEKCLEVYTVSFEENNIIEAAANLLWWMCLLGSVYFFDDEAFNALGKLSNKKIDKKDFLKNHWLINYDINYESRQNKIKEKLKYVREIDDLFITCTKALKESSEWFNLGDYYLAMKYIYCLVDNNQSDDTNYNIGCQMMLLFASLGNDYAKTFVSCYEIKKI